MPNKQSTIVFLGDVANANDNDHVVNTASYGFDTSNRKTILRMWGNDDRLSIVVSHGFGAGGDVPDARNCAATSHGFGVHDCMSAAVSQRQQ